MPDTVHSDAWWLDWAEHLGSTNEERYQRIDSLLVDSPAEAYTTSEWITISHIFTMIKQLMEQDKGAANV